MNKIIIFIFFILQLKISSVYGYIYHKKIDIEPDNWNGPYTGGPMYTLTGFPGISTGTPFVGFKGQAFLANKDRSYIGNLTIIVSSNPTPLTKDAYPKSSVCKADFMQPSDEILQAFGGLSNSYSFELVGGETRNIDFRSEISKTEYQFATFVFCSPKNTEVGVTGSLMFRNPFGYLPSSIYGYLPFTGILAVLYFALAVVYGALAIRHRDSVHWIQIFIFLVIVMGFIETTTWFLTFVMLNETGEPPCCPPRPDILFALGTSNLKRTVSAVLILAVSIGWGVAKPTLDLSTKLKITILGLLHFAFSVYNEMKRIEVQSKVDHQQPSIIWSIPVAVCNVIFVFWIYFALEHVQEELQQLRQHAKLQMYQRLSRTLATWVITWILFSIFLLLVNSQVIQLSWKFEFVPPTFWDLSYFGILFSIARIWIPSHTSSAYAYSQQIPSTDVLDEFDSSALEMNAPVQASVSNGKNGSSGKSARVEDNDDDDVEIDIGLDDNDKKNGRKKVANT